MRLILSRLCLALLALPLFALLTATRKVDEEEDFR